jgi:MFS family permease
MSVAAAGLPKKVLAGLILASALITLDGTGTTIALPAIGRDLNLSVATLQWIANAPLLILAAMLLPAGTLADRFGRIRMMRIGLMCFVVASLGCAAARSDLEIIGARFVQGAGGALVLPATLAVLRGAYTNPTERTRVFGVWAAWTGVASAGGPLIAGALVDVWEWRAVFLPPAVAGVVALLLIHRGAPAASAARTGPIPIKATFALMVLLAGVAYLLMLGPAGDLAGRGLAVGFALAGAAGVVLTRDRHRGVLLPRELRAARNCFPANAITFAFYFGMFGLSFLVVLYVQQVLGNSASWAAVALLPMSVMLFFAEPFGRLAGLIGTRALILAGAIAAAGGIAWMGVSAHPLPFWSHIMLGTGVFGLGLSLAVSALTNAAVAAVPDACAGAASGLNHAVVRGAGLLAVAAVGSISAPGSADAISVEGFQRALLVCAAVVAAGGIGGTLLLSDHEPGGLAKETTG